MTSFSAPARRMNLARHLLWMVPLVFLAIFFFIPLGKIITVMLTSGGEVSISRIIDPLVFTVWQATLSTVLTLVVGLPAAYLFSHFTFPGRRLLRLLVTLPFILPTVVVAAGFNALLGPHGWINLLLMKALGLSLPPITFLNTFGAILIAHVFYNTSIFIRVVGTAWSSLDTKLTDAGRVLGASPVKNFFKVTLPLLKSSLLAAGLLVFLFDFTSFGVILLLGGAGFSTLETEIYTQTLSMLNLRMAGILSLVQLACTLIVTLLYSKVNHDRFTSLKSGVGVELENPRGLFKSVFVGLSIAILLILFLLPMLSLVVRSFISYSIASETSVLTVANYQNLFVNQRQSYFYVPPVRAALNSLGFASLTLFLSSLLGFSTAYAQTRIPTLKKWIDSVIMLPMGTSAVTLGLGFLITFNRPPLDVATFPALIPIAHTLIAFPFVLRAILPALNSIPRNLKDAAQILGASSWRVWWQVEAPIVSRAAIVGGIYAFAISLGEFGATSFLARPALPTLPVAIFRFLSLPGELNYGQALAMATLLLVFCAIAIVLIEKIPLPGQQDY